MEFDIQMPQVSQYQRWISILYQVLLGCEHSEYKNYRLQQDLGKDSLKRQMIDRPELLALIDFSPSAEGKRTAQVCLRTVKLSYNSSI